MNTSFNTLNESCLFMIPAELTYRIDDTQAPNPYQEYVIAYVTSAFTGLLLYWHESGKKISLGELTTIAHGILLNGIRPQTV